MRDEKLISWDLRQVHFHYRLGDWTFFRASLPLQHRRAGLFEEPAEHARLFPPAEHPVRDSFGFVVRAMPIRHNFPLLARRNGYLCYVPLQYAHYHVNLMMTFDEYAMKFSSKTRSTLNRKVRRYAEHCGGLSFKTYKKPEEVAEFFRLARRISALTYQERLLKAGLPGDESFVRAAEGLAADNRLRAYILFCGERPVSYLYCPVTEGVVVYAYLGYDPEFRHLSVGTVLQWLSLAELFEERCFRAFDFTEGVSDHKRLFSTDSRRCANVFLLKDCWKTRAIVYGDIAVGRVSKFVGGSLECIGLKRGIKRALRFGWMGKPSST